MAVSPEVFVLAFLLAALLAAFAIWKLLGLRLHSGGTLEYADRVDSTAALVSPGLRLSGRPDEIIRLRSGQLVPVEWKSRSTPRHGPPNSHRIQVFAYCALVEDSYGSPPPYGVLRYGDGQEFQLEWDATARAELREVLVRARSPYDGRANPGPNRCPRCPWVETCDARWTGRSS